MFRGVARLKRQRKALMMLAADLALLPLALWSAFLLGGQPPTQGSEEVLIYLFAPMFAIPVFIRMGLYRAIVRYMDDRVVWVVAVGVSISVLMMIATVHLLGWSVPRTVFPVYWGIAALYVGGSRFVARGVILGRTKALRPREPVIIYGAGSAGTQVAMSVRDGSEFHVVAFVDDDKERQNTTVGGVAVYSPEELPDLLFKYEVRTVLFAIPSVSRARRNAIMSGLENLQIRWLTVPVMADLLSGAVRVEDIHEVEIEDLLGRDVVPSDTSLLSSNIRGKSVLVTGAGGSIGSELCRQILLQKPSRLVLFELNEFGLYQIDQELQAKAAKRSIAVDIVPLLGSIQDRQRMEQAMRCFGVETVYHAAAYKHVPLVEFNPVEGVRNNVFGTWRTAQAAVSAGVKKFVLISTDKAVRPANVMGATKRLAELILQSMSVEFPETCFAMVRFGNVLGSSGSVVPLFRSQIKAGGPITITHPEITRYFMTIPEASQLVIQAGAMAKGGDVFVLDMGPPVKIIDLARRMVHLSGLEIKDEQHPDGDVEIRITGLRPGEKLFEELLIGNNVSGTTHPLIMRADEEMIPWSLLKSRLGEIEEAAEAFDLPALRQLLLRTVTGYKPAADIEDLVWVKSDALARAVIDR